MKIQFTEVTDSYEHVAELYEILKKRSHHISHVKMPSFEDHTKFVKNYPYRKWYLIKQNNLFVGAIYIQKDNTVSINLIEMDSFVLKESIIFVLDNHEPLVGIPSVRSNKFTLNVPATNQDFVDFLNDFGSKLVEMRFVIEKK